MQNLKKNWLAVCKISKFDKFSREHLKGSKFVLSWDPFVQSWMSKRKKHELKTYRGVMYNGTEEWRKI